ncbi:hypothetical protein INT44_001494 [Umbelopsis vinacea]|uniref:Uncharacterized protein n=1 Tax=Umbelopsis vinacea TaxID=44442 RepID=A0A8H7UGG7_9FUNG|nr:hypothetical protein INT44_001494 [Umbelopsis vinacea]
MIITGCYIAARAQYFGLSDRSVIEPGRRAALVLIAGDPLQDIRATRLLKRIWCVGIEVKPIESGSGDFLKFDPNYCILILIVGRYLTVPKETVTRPPEMYKT